ncbi:hypothetical protein [Parafrankia sp. FMc2]|uniref:hypothetical protein n=1 Tax=Parafrankia sp. FMc2 TaxID=3233196 RepID=UPI0034D5E99A
MPSGQAAVTAVTGSAQLAPTGTVTPPGQKVRPGGQPAVDVAEEPSQQATSDGRAGTGRGHDSPGPTLTGLFGHWTRSTGQSAAEGARDPSAQRTP